MNKILQLTTFLWVAVSIPGQADNVRSQELVRLETTSIGPGEDDNLRGFTLQHFVEQTPLEKIEIKPEPWTLLQTFKNTLLALSDKHPKPLKIETQIGTISSQPFPALSMKTTIDGAGNGISDLQIPKFQGKSSIDWQGLTGQLNFTDKFKNVTLVLKGGAFSFKKPGTMFISSSPFTFTGTFDADFMPQQMDFNWPGLDLTEAEAEVSMKNLAFTSKVAKTPIGVEISNGRLQIENIGWVAEGFKTWLEGVSLAVQGNLEKGLVRYLLQTQIDQLMINELTTRDNFGFTYLGNLEVRRIDAEALRELQKTVREMQKQVQNGLINQDTMGIVMLGKLMELAPKLLAGSPEVAISSLNLKNQAGKLQGDLTMGIEGNKIISLSDLDSWIRAWWANAQLQISKSLLESLVLRYEQAQLKGSEKFEQAKTKAQKRIQMYLDQKWLVSVGSDYKLTSHLKAGKWVVNDRVLPLPWLTPPKTTTRSSDNRKAP